MIILRQREFNRKLTSAEKDVIAKSREVYLNNRVVKGDDNAKQIARGTIGNHTILGEEIHSEEERREKGELMIKEPRIQKLYKIAIDPQLTVFDNAPLENK